MPDASAPLDPPALLTEAHDGAALDCGEPALRMSTNTMEDPKTSNTRARDFRYGNEAIMQWH